MANGQYTAELHMRCCDAVQLVGASWEFHPGVHTLPNGDPGYPPSSDFWLDLPEKEGAPSCPNCGHVFTDDELEDLIINAEQQHPAEEHEPDFDELATDTDIDMTTEDRSDA